MSDKWVRDTGLVFALLFLVIGFKGHTWALVVSGLFLLSLLFVPSLLRPLAKLWLLLTEVLAKVMNKVFFGIVFFAVVVPIGYAKRLSGGDMRDHTRNASRTTAFVGEKRLFTKQVFEKPF